jgi:hypothetical protein
MKEECEMEERLWDAETGPGRQGQEIGRVIADHHAAFPDPLVVRDGEQLAVGDRQTEWHGWLWCTGQDGKGGWVPEGYVERRGDRAALLVDYDATELSVRTGEEVLVGEEVGDWRWCTNHAGQSGWVPVRNLAAVSRRTEG